MPRGNQRFTIYDAMDAKGVFEENSANATALGYKGPVAYPKMFYHPKGETRITVPAEIIMTPLGPKAVGEQREIIWQIVATPAEEKALRLAGWHDHPAKAIAAGGGVAPATSPANRIADLEAESAKLQAEKTGALATEAEIASLGSDQD